MTPLRRGRTHPGEGVRGKTHGGSPSGSERRRWLVSGKVQGVGFRFHVLRCATRLGVVGDVRNLDDGRVEIRAQGSIDQLERLLDDVRRGPTWSRVEKVENVEATTSPRFEDFRIR